MKFVLKIYWQIQSKYLTNKSIKRFIYGKKNGKPCNRGKPTQMPVTSTEGVAATDKG